MSDAPKPARASDRKTARKVILDSAVAVYATAMFIVLAISLYFSFYVHATGYTQGVVWIAIFAFLVGSFGLALLIHAVVDLLLKQDKVIFEQADQANGEPNHK